MASFNYSYSNSAAIANADELFGIFTRDSQNAYATHSTAQRTIAYGTAPRETLDWFSCGKPGADVLVFIHGGYWQECTKDDFAFIVNAPLAAGLDVVLLEYTLTPECSLTHICQQIGKALDSVHATLKTTSPTSKVFLTGHSAGGHLTAYWQHHPVVHAAFPLSGIFDLEPILHTPLNDALRLTSEEIESLSPCRLVCPQEKPLVLLYGADEIPTLVAQSLCYEQTLAMYGITVPCIAVKGTNHFTILQKAFAPDGDILRLIKEYA